VLTSGVSSLPEVAGGPTGAVLCDPHQPATIAAGLRRLASEADLRQQLRAAGLANVQRFSWERSAAVLWQALQLAMNQPRG
jgi:glycosyltransferase involved in cell wall biosynthesis